MDMDPHKLTYSLVIVQQPIRARMCGFGDKDRRNVTPAPVLKLEARKPNGELVESSDLGERNFVVTAELLHEDGSEGRNLVVISSIPSSRTPAYSQQQVVVQLGIQQSQPSYQIWSTTGTGEKMSPASPISAAALPGQSSTSTASRMSISNVINVEDEISSRPIRSLPKVPPSQRGATRSGDVSDADTQTPGEQQDDGDEGSIDDENELDNRPYVQQDLKELEAIQLKGPGTHELHTRNLVGQLHTNGQVANDLENDKPQIWFAFSILSIRTEGYFRIRFCLTDVSRIHEGTGGSSETICEVLSDVIHVQTPKKFEGTCDNSKLAVHLNKNGIRIPARKDDKKERKKKAGMASPTSSLD